jgi:mono/diheme cytochrome c family protein
MTRLEHSRSLWKILAGSIVLVLSAACGSGGGGSSSGGGGGGGSLGLQANFASIQDKLFTPICTACHAGANAPQGLRLDAANSYALLVGVASAEAPSVQRVKPGDPTNSYLIQKLSGTAAVGSRMPLNGTPLVQADIDMIKQWIADGAQPAAPPAGTPIRVTSLSIIPGSTVTQMPASLLAGFDRELNATTVDATTFLVERSGGDGTFGDGNEVAIPAASITVPAANPTSAVFDLTGAPQVDDTYRVTLRGAGATVILDLGGNALDGEFGGTFPSGNGTAGGDFVAEFTVASVQPTLASIQQNVFTPICAACHTGPTSGVLPAGMDLSGASASLASLVGVASLEVPSVERVTAGDPDASYLVQKIEGTAASGARMPFGGAPLPQSTIDAIRQWITNGANP